MPMSRLLARDPRDVLRRRSDRARRRRVEARQQPQRRGLAAAGRAEQREQLAGLERRSSPSSAAVVPKTRSRGLDCRPPGPGWCRVDHAQASSAAA